MDLGNRWKYNWIFVVTDVTQAILGADFLTHHNLLVDLRRKRLVDEETRMCSPGQLIRVPTPTISTIDRASIFKYLLSEFTKLTSPNPPDAYEILIKYTTTFRREAHRLRNPRVA